MKKFFVSLLSNRFGIVLAVLNLCVFAGMGRDLFNYPLGRVLVAANLPALISGGFMLELAALFSHGLSFSTRNVLVSLFLGLFITLQWLFIAWLSKTIAAKLRKFDR